MKQGWCLLRIKDICSKGSSNIKQNELEKHNGTYPIYGASGLIKNVDFYHQEKEYIAIVKDGSGIGRVMFLPEKSSIIGTLQYILPKDGFSIRYIGYCLQSLNLKEYKRGAAIPHIYFKDYGEREVCVTNSLSEQQRIVDILDAEFAKIDALKSNAEKQLQNAKDLFQAALRKELEPKEGWRRVMLKEIANYTIGLTYKPDNVCEQGTIVLRSSNIQNGKIDLTDLVRVNVSIKPSLYVQKGDILMCSRNGNKRLVGKVAIIDEMPEPMTYGTFMMIIKSIYNPFLYYFFSSNDFKKQVFKGESNMINQITRYMLDEVELVVPPEETINAIASSLNSLNSTCLHLQSNYEKTIALCDDMKQSLLRKAFNGEL